MDHVDQSILDAVARSDHDAAAALVLRHFGPRLLGQARALVGAAAAEDILLETVLSLLDAIEAGRCSGSSLFRYALGIVRYKASHPRDSFWHRLFHRRAVDPEVMAELPGDAPAPDEPGADDLPDVGDILAGLTERERVVLTLRLEGMSYASIGRALGVSEANAAQIHSRAVRRLREALSAERRPAPP